MCRLGNAGRDGEIRLPEGKKSKCERRKKNVSKEGEEVTLELGEGWQGNCSLVQLVRWYLSNKHVEEATGIPLLGIKPSPSPQFK